MADNLTTQSATPATVPASSVISTEEVTTLNGGAVSAQHLQRVAVATRTADGTAIDLPASTADGVLVNLGTNNDMTVTGTVAVTQSGTWDEVGINDSGNSITIDNAQLSVVGTGTEAAAMRVTIATDSTGVLSVDDNGGALTVDGTVTANLAAGTNNIGDVDILSIAAGTNNIGDVDVLTLPAIPTGTNTIGSVKITDGTDTALVDASGNLMVNVAAGGAGDGSILDGVSSSIKATVLDYASSNPLAVRLTDTGGDYVGAGAGTQYTVDAVAPAAPVGTALVAERDDQLSALTEIEGDWTNARATSKGALWVALADSSGDPITSFGGGTQYTEDAVAAADPVGTALNLVRLDTPAAIAVDGDNVAARGNSAGAQYVELLSGTAKVGGDATNGLDVDVTRVTGTVTIAGAVTNAGTFATQVDGAALTSLQLADDVVATLGTTTYTEAATKGTLIGAVRRDADTTLVDTTNEVAPLQVDANGRLKVEAFSGETLPVSMTSTTVTGTVAVTQSGTWDEVGINDSGNSITVDNGGTFVTQENGALLTSSQLIDDAIFTAGTSTFTEATSKGNLSLAVRRDANTSLVDTTNEMTPLQVNATGELKVAVIQALPAGSAAIGKLAANSGVDIGDVDILSIAAGDNNIGNVDIVSGTITTVSTVTAITGGNVAHDVADGGNNPIKVGAKASATLSDDTMVSNADRTDLTSDLDGAIYVRAVPLGDLITEAISNTDGASTATTNFAATASARNYITSINVFRTDAATTMAYIDFRDGTAGAVLYRMPLPPAGGAVQGNGEAPLFYTTANTALAFDVSSALTTVYINLTGFKSKVRA